MNSVYKINKGINRPIEFKGLKAQYIGYLAVGLVALLIIFAVLYLIGVNMFICLGIISVVGTGLFSAVYRMSETYGQHGLIKKIARLSIPDFLRSDSRSLFIDLSKNQLPSQPE